MAGPPTPPVTSALPTGDRPDHLGEMSEDEAALAALGYKQEFKVTVAINSDVFSARQLTAGEARVLRLDDFCRQLCCYGASA